MTLSMSEGGNAMAGVGDSPPERCVGGKPDAADGASTAAASPVAPFEFATSEGCERVGRVLRFGEARHDSQRTSTETAALLPPQPMAQWQLEIKEVSLSLPLCFPQKRERRRAESLCHLDSGTRYIFPELFECSTGLYSPAAIFCRLIPEPRLNKWSLWLVVSACVMRLLALSRGPDLTSDCTRPLEFVNRYMETLDVLYPNFKNQETLRNKAGSKCILRRQRNLPERARLRSVRTSYPCSDVLENLLLWKRRYLV